MGRYAFFNTGYEYKFGFGVQNSEDIETFGGITLPETSMSDPVQSWTEDCKPFILEELNDILDFYSHTMDLETYLNSFSHDVKGTTMMQSDIWRTLKKDLGVANESTLYRFKLGCVIYHQLLYQKELSAQYEW